jgi:hypothetical protein
MKIPELARTVVARIGLGKALVLFVFALLLIYRPQAIFYPPYWDAVLGFFHEAIWLSQNNFHYAGLAFEQDGYLAGGPRIYLLSIVPTFIALLMKALPDVRVVFVVLHLGNYLLAGGVIYLVTEIVRTRLHLCYALLAGLALLCQPMFVAQAYQLNAEILMSFLCLLALKRYLEQRHVEAGCWMVLAYFVKQPAVLFAFSMAGVFLVTQLRTRRQIFPFLLYLFPFVLMMFADNVLAAKLHNPRSIPELGGVDFRQYFELWYIKQQVMGMVGRVPDLFVVFIVVPALSSLVITRTVLGYIRGKRFFSVLKEHALELILIATTAMFLLKSVTLISWIPRYMTYLIPGILILLALLLSRFSKRIGGATFGLIIIWGILNQFGMFYKQSTANNGYVLERSLEYEADLELNQLITKTVEQNFSDRPIITHWPLTHMLMMPGFGYVETPQHVISLNRSGLAWTGMATFLDLPVVERRDPSALWVISPNLFVGVTGLDPEKHRLIATMETGGRTAKVWSKAPQVPGE